MVLSSSYSFFNLMKFRELSKVVLFPNLFIFSLGNLSQLFTYLYVKPPCVMLYLLSNFIALILLFFYVMFFFPHLVFFQLDFCESDFKARCSICAIKNFEVFIFILNIGLLLFIKLYQYCQTNMSLPCIQTLVG